MTTLHGLADARYPSGDRAGSEKRFGDTMLSQALTEVVIPSYDLSAPGPYFFKREYAVNEARTGMCRWSSLPARPAPRRRTSIRRYSCPTTDGTQHALVDGGTFANNPSLSGLRRCMRLKDAETPRIVVVSIGTGLPPQTPGSGPIPIGAERAADFGLARWARPILEVVLDGVPKAVEYQMGVIATAHPGGLTYHRLQSDLPTASHALDDASPANCAKLIADAGTLIDKNMAKLEEICAEVTG